MLVIAADDFYVPGGYPASELQAKVYVLGPGFSGWTWSYALNAPGEESGPYAVY